MCWIKTSKYIYYLIKLEHEKDMRIFYTITNLPYLEEAMGFEVADEPLIKMIKKTIKKDNFEYEYFLRVSIKELEERNDRNKKTNDI